MLITYSLDIKSSHLKFLLLGVLSVVDLVKKKEYIKVVGFTLKNKKQRIKKYTILKSPFINKKSREQFKLQVHLAAILFSVRVISKRFLFVGGYLEKTLLNHLNSQYIEVRLTKKYAKFSQTIIPKHSIQKPVWRNW
jgi:ribosomal protein S10